MLLLPCTASDAGLQWSYSAFGEGTLLHRATMQCLTANGAELALHACVDAADPAQQWSVTGKLVSKTTSGTCAQVTTAAAPPCVIKTTITLSPATPKP